MPVQFLAGSKSKKVKKMADKQSILNELEHSIKKLQQEAAVEGAKKALAAGVSPVEAIDALSRGIREVGEKYAK